MCCENIQNELKGIVSQLEAVQKRLDVIQNLVSSIQAPKQDRLPLPEVITPPERTYLNVDETAQLLKVSKVSLNRWRANGTGPLYMKFGRRVLYSLKDIQDFANENSKQSTSQ